MNEAAIQQESLKIDLSDIEVEEIEILSQEGGRGLPEFAASSCDSCNCGVCSCTEDQ